MSRLSMQGLVGTAALRPLQRFLKLESASGVVLVLMAVLAMIVANSSLSATYYSLLNVEVTIGSGAFSLTEPVLLWINDGLMAIFFLLVSMEIKREMIQGQLSSLDQALLPGIAALGGVIVPALIYVYFNAGNAEAMRGWAVPSATDIAFSLGVISLLGKRVPIALKIFLTTLAVMDDLAAIVIIALFYSGSLSLAASLVALACIVILLLMNRFHLRSLALYLLVGLVLWVAVLKSGVHATLAGVVLAFLIPLKQAPDETCEPLLSRLEHALHPWVAFGIMPLFAFANAGLSLQGMALPALAEPITLGIALGLLLGKPVGIFSITWLAVKTNIARMPIGSDWYSVLAVGVLGGIGFTMSLFIASLAYSPVLQSEARLGILAGSLASAVVGYTMFRMRKMP